MKKIYIIFLLIAIGIYFLSNFTFSANNLNVYQEVIKNLTNLKFNSIYFTIENSSKIDKEGYKKFIKDLDSNKILETNKEENLDKYLDIDKYIENYKNLNIYLKAEGFYNNLSKNGKLDLINFKIELDSQKFLDISLEGKLFSKEEIIYLLLKNFYLNEQISFNSNNSENIYLFELKKFIDANLKNKWVKIEYYSDYLNDNKNLKHSKNTKSISHLLKNKIFTLNKINSEDINLEKYEIILTEENLNNIIELIKLLNKKNKDLSFTDKEIEEIENQLFNII